jgi:Uma2 family endonuclease
VQEPLALEDILHPQEEDFRVLSDPHNEDCRYLKSVFKARLADDPHALVLSDCRVSWDPTGAVGYGPDVAVFRRVREPNQNWTTFNAVDEGVGPQLIIEVTSPETRSTDLANKAQLYHDHGVPVYVIADRGRRPGQSPFRLLGFRHAPDGYEALAANDRGWLWLEAVGLWLGIEGNRVVCYEADGKRVPDYMELAQQLKAAEEAKAAMEARLREIEEQLRPRPDSANGAKE